MNRIRFKRIFDSSEGNYDAAAKVFFKGCRQAGSPVPIVEKGYINDVIVQLKTTLSLNGTTTNWDEIDRITLGAISKIIGIRNVKSNAHHGVIVDDYAGSFTDGGGFLGNGTSFHILTNYNPGDGSTYKWTQNSAKCFFLNLSTSIVTGYSLGSTNLASTNGTIVSAGRTASYATFLDTNVNTFAGAGLPEIAYNRCWIGHERTASNAGKGKVNGSPYADTHVSAAVPNFQFVEFARNKGGTIQDFSNNAKGITVYGSKDIDDFAVQKIFEQYFLKKRALADWMPNRLQTLGDSMTAQGVNGNRCRWTRTALESLGNTWQGHTNGLAGGIISQIEAVAVTNTDPFQKPYLSRDIVAFWAGTNDLANSAPTTTGTDIYNRYKTFLTNRKAAGYTKFIFIGMVDRDATFPGRTQAEFDTDRALFNTLMNADFTVATSVANVKTSSLGFWAGCCFVDVWADAKFANAADITYFMADLIHPNTTLDDVLANTYIVPTINANIV